MFFRLLPGRADGAYEDGVLAINHPLPPSRFLGLRCRWPIAVSAASMTSWSPGLLVRHNIRRRERHGLRHPLDCLSRIADLASNMPWSTSMAASNCSSVIERFSQLQALAHRASTVKSFRQGDANLLAGQLAAAR